MSEDKDPSIKPFRTTIPVPTALKQHEEAEEQKMEQELFEEGSSTEMIMEQELIEEGGSSTEMKGALIFLAGHANMIKVDDGVKEQIMRALSTRNPGENIIGLYGQNTKVHDVVKTAIRRAQRDQLFQQIVTAFVIKQSPFKKIPSKKFAAICLRRIQSQIGAAIGLSFDDDYEPDPACFVFLGKDKRMSTAERASLLCAKMKELQTVLVVLSDLHGSLDLNMVGIPSAEDHKGCKILLTSSSHDVLSNEMKAHVLIIEVW